MRPAPSFGLALCLVLLACKDPAQKLSKEEELLYDAVLYALTGVEDNGQGGSGRTTWKKETGPNYIQFTNIGRNNLYFGDPELEKRIRRSKFLKYIYKLTSEKRCAFRFEHRQEYSKGDSETEFSVIDEGINLLNSVTFDFGNAHTFDFSRDQLNGYVITLEGPKVVCGEETNECQNIWRSVNSRLTSTQLDFDDEAALRRSRAVDLVRKACPARPF